ncbi:MAG: hypothetical protein HUU57_05740 [Bdellovibrio sp.]|nr:hypothetical protein [Bdellovibrio sp.]
MFSKISRNLFCAVALVLAVTGCSEFLNGKKSEPEVIEFSDSRLVCLKSIPAQLEQFSIGEAKENEIRAGFDCMADALLYFNKRTFGSVENGYTVEEMRRFFGKYFLKENNVSPEFAGELMKIKKALLGGSTEHITKDEVVRLVEILKVTRDEAVELAPHMKILLSAKDQKKADWDKITAAVAQFRRGLLRLLEKTQIAKSEYSFEDAKKAFSGFADFIRGGTPFAPYNLYSEWVPVVESVKNVLLGSRAHFVDLPQWSAGLDSFVDLYELALKYHHSLRDMDFSNAAKLRQVNQFIAQTLKLLSNSHQMQTTGRIPLHDIDYLLEQVVPKFSKTLDIKALKKSYRVILMKMLDPARLQDTRSLIGLERKHLATLQREFNIWRLQQSFIDHLPFNQQGSIAQEDILAAYRKFNKTFVIEKGLSDDPFEQAAYELAWLDLGDILGRAFMVSFNPQGRLNIFPSSAQPPLQWKGLMKANLTRALSRMLLLGYGDKTQGRMSNATMSKQQLISWYDDFQELGLNLNIFDRRSANSGERSFLEANFFTFSGDGNEVMSGHETFEFVSTLFAAGLSTADALRVHMETAKCTVPTKDVFDFPLIKELCFKHHLREHIGVYFNNLPGLVKFVRSLDDTQWNEFYGYLAVASAVEGQRLMFVETANIRTMVMILHYIEGVMVMYDRDDSGALSLQEVFTAAPRFTPFFRSVTGVDSEAILQAGFAHLVFRGTIPGADAPSAEQNGFMAKIRKGIATIKDLANFGLDTLRGVGEARRMEIARLFGTLKDQLNKP